jgi:uncharacterized membrane protein YkoI
MTTVRLAACALACSLLASAQTGPDWGGMLRGAKVGLSEAMEKGLKEAGEGTVFHGELEGGAAGAVYSIDVAQGEKTCNVLVSPKDGTVVKKATEAEDHSKSVAACKVGLADAVASVLKIHPGKAVEAQMTLKSGKPGVTVKVWGDGRLTTVRLDGASGEVVSIENDDPWTDTFVVDKADLASRGRNPFFVLEPGYELVYEGKDGKDTVKLIVTVLDDTKTVDGVECRVVEEREWENEELIEVSRNWFAISKRTNSVYYFGEEVDVYRGGKVVSHSGAWESGKDGARFGLLMPGEPLLGARHYQEVAPGVAMDRAEVTSLTAKKEVPAGKFEGVLKVAETTPLEPGNTEYKYYARDVGLIQDGPAKLVKYGMKKK